MQNITFTVKGMSCMGCVSSVRKVLETMAGVSSVEVSLEEGRVSVAYDSVGPEQLKAAIEDAGYEVVGQS